MSSFRDLKNASGRDSKIVRDFASSDICICILWVFHKLVITSLQVLEEVSPLRSTFWRALTVGRTVIGRPPTQCCQMHDNYPLKISKLRRGRGRSHLHV